jgi:Fic family protein
MGRLLILLLLHTEGALACPLLYLSLYFKQRRAEYYEALMNVRLRGAWEEWLAFYLAGIEEVAKESAVTADRAVKIFATDRRRLEALGRASASALKIHGLLEKHCLLSLALARKELGLSLPTVTQAMARLRRLGIVREISGKRRKQVFSYHAYWKLISKGMESAE